jgi:predicted glycosyltransferase
VKWYEGWVQRWHCKLLRSFDELWIPDSPDSKYAGKLSENKDQHKVEYIGILSRFSIYTKPIDKDIERLVIISGPTVYGKQQLQEELSKHDDGVTYFVADKDIFEELNLIGEQFVSSNDWTSADQIILRAKKIISRSGYSTLMDLVELKAAYEITPTRGQREQEYLFGLWNNNPLC